MISLSTLLIAPEVYEEVIEYRLFISPNSETKAQKVYVISADHGINRARPFLADAQTHTPFTAPDTPLFSMELQQVCRINPSSDLGNVRMTTSSASLP